MKKIITLITTLLLIWLGFLYYANITTESKLHNYTAKMNAMYKEMDLGVSLKISEYTSDFFSATVQYSITINPQKLLKFTAPDIAFILRAEKSKTKDISNIFKKPFTISQHIAYGPVFFDNGIEFGRAKSTYKATLTNALIAIIHKINAQVDKNNKLRISDKKMEKLKAEIDDVLKKEVNIEYSSILALFSDDNTVVATISEIDIKQGMSTLQMQPITINSTYNLGDFTGDMQFNIPLIVAKHNGIEKLHITNLTLDYDINEFISIFEYFGGININAEQVKFNLSRSKGNIALKLGFTSDIEKGIAQHFSNINTRIQAEILQYPNNKPPLDLPKNIELNIDMLEFNMAEFSKTMHAIQEYMYVELLTKKHNKVRTPEEFFTQDIKPHLSRIVRKDNTKFNIGLSIITEQLSTITNTIRLNTTYTLSDDNLNELFNVIIAHKDKAKRLNLLKQAANVEIDIKLAKQLAKAFEPLLAIPRQMQLIVEDKNMLTTNVVYKQGKVYINGKENEVINQQLQMLEETVK